jgi:acetyl-CoA C-acetyltransferase
MELALERAMAATRLRTDHIKYFDLYSCFPCAVLIAAEALGLDWRKTTPTVTGGLPFFGGAGNNYSMHAIASMADRLRADPGRYGLVLANGGYLSKEAVGIYSTTPPTDWNPISSADLQGALDATPAQQVLNADTEATIESFTVTFAKGRPQHACIAAKTPEGRVLARAHNDHLATIASLTTDEPIGKTVRIVHDGGKNYFEPVDHIGAHASTGALARKLAHVTVQRDGHVLEVTLNRPERLNALQSETSFELHEIWDAFEQDSELWVAIITGAGDRAFSSGNDLKVTAKGAEMLLPQSGFAGLCSRFNREKPVIAAVNGLAMGGGLEIVLACDLAVADDRAKFALPEVKVGLFAGAGGVQGLTRQIGRKAAMELILTGRHIGAAEAHALGIVNSVVPAGTALPEARRLAQALLANSPSAIRACRQALNALDRIEGLQEARDQSNAVLDRLLRTRDFREGVTAFAEKRLPNWSNS